MKELKNTYVLVTLLIKKGYKVLSLDSNLVFVSRDVKFYESVFPFKLKSSSLTNKSNVPLNSSDLFPMMSHCILVLFLITLV